MADPSIAAIQQAEEQAAILCRMAEEKAAEMRASATAKGEQLLKTTEEATEAEIAEMLRGLEERAASLGVKKREEAQKEAEQLRDGARQKLPEAINLLVWEIVEKCQ